MKEKKPGFTLIETVIALILTVIILSIASSMFIIGNKVFSNSDIKSTLQIEGQTIQEKISDIGMQSNGVQNLDLDSSHQMSDMVINSYVYDNNENLTLQPFEIQKIDSGRVYKDGSKIYELSVGGQVISNNVESVNLDDSTIGNVKTPENINSIEFNIWLKKENGYSSVVQPVDFRITFRNK